MKKAPIARSLFRNFNPGGDLRSRAVTRAVSSALQGLTSVFGMGTGVTLAVRPPGNLRRDEAARQKFWRTLQLKEVGETNRKFHMRIMQCGKANLTTHVLPVVVRQDSGGFLRASIHFEWSRD